MATRYLGGLLCSADGLWPAGADLARIEAAFRRCGIELWELYGHGPPEEGRSYAARNAALLRGCLGVPLPVQGPESRVHRDV